MPWDTAHVFYVWYDALVNYLTAIGYGEDQAALRRRGGRPCTTSSARTSSGSTACGGRPCAWRPASTRRPTCSCTAGCSCRARRCRSRRPTRSRRRDLTDDFGVDAVRYLLLRDTPFGADGDFSYEGITARYNADLANNLGNLLARVATVVGLEVRRAWAPPPIPTAGSRAVSRRRSSTTPRAAWDGGATPPRPRGDVAAHPRDQRRARGDRAVEGGARAGRRRRPRQRARGAAHRGAAGVAGHARHQRRDLAPARARRASRASAGCPPDAAWGGYPGGLPVEKGPRCSPDEASDAGDAPTGARRRSLDRFALPPPGPLPARGRRAVVDAVVEAAAAGVGGVVCVGTDADDVASGRGAGRRSVRDLAGPTSGRRPAPAIRGVGDGGPSSPRGLARRRGGRARPRRRRSPTTPGVVVAVGECGLDYHYEHSPRADAARRVRRPGRAGAAARPDPRRAYARGVGRHPRRVARRRGRPSAW